MTPESLSTLVNIGSAGAVIAVVVIFLNFISKRDKDWQSFFSSIRAADNQASAQLTTAIEKLVARIESLEGRFNVHEAAEMEVLRDLMDNLRKPARGRQ